MMLKLSFSLRRANETNTRSLMSSVHGVSLMLLSIIKTSGSHLAFCQVVQMVSCTLDALLISELKASCIIV